MDVHFDTIAREPAVQPRSPLARFIETLAKLGGSGLLWLQSGASPNLHGLMLYREPPETPDHDRHRGDRG